MAIFYNLNELIQSLSQAEKTYFLKYCSIYSSNKPTNYKKLFKEIGNQLLKGNYNEKQLEQMFSNEKFIKQLNVTKHYLFKLILKSLSSYYSSSIETLKILDYIKQIDILYFKKQYRLCDTLIKKTKKLCYLTEQYEQLLIILNYESAIMPEKTTTSGYLEDTSNKIFYEQDKIIQLIKEKYLFKRLYIYCWVNYYRFLLNKSKTDLNKLKNISKRKDLKNGNKLKTYYSKFYYLSSKYVIYKALSKHIAMLDASIKLVKLCELNLYSLSGSYYVYITLLSNMCRAAFSCGDKAILAEGLSKLKNLPESNRIKNPANAQFNSFKQYYFLILEIAIKTADIKDSLNSMKELEAGLKKYNRQLIDYDKAMLYKMISTVYFLDENYGASLQWLNKVFSLRRILKNDLIYVKALIFELILHYELNNRSLLQYKERSINHFFKKRILQEDERELLSFIRKETHGKKNNTDNLLKSKNTLRKIAPDIHYQKYEYVPGMEFDFRIWIDSKLSGTSYRKMLQKVFKFGKVPS
jgi:hypothetical protein